MFSPIIHNTLANGYNSYAKGKMRCAIPSQTEFNNALAANNAFQQKHERIVLAGKHLAIKLAEVYKEAGYNPNECKAIKEFMEALK